MRISAATEQDNGKKRATFREETITRSQDEQSQTLRKPLEFHSDIFETEEKARESPNLRELSKRFSPSIKNSAIKDSKLRDWNDNSEGEVFMEQA